MAKKKQLTTIKSIAGIRSWKDAEVQFKNLNNQVSNYVSNGAVEVDRKGNFVWGKVKKSELKLIEAVS